MKLNCLLLVFVFFTSVITACEGNAQCPCHDYTMDSTFTCPKDIFDNQNTIFEFMRMVANNPEYSLDDIWKVFDGITPYCYRYEAKFSIDDEQLVPLFRKLNVIKSQELEHFYPCLSSTRVLGPAHLGYRVAFATSANESFMHILVNPDTADTLYINQSRPSSGYSRIVVEDGTWYWVVCGIFTDGRFPLGIQPKDYLDETYEQVFKNMLCFALLQDVDATYGNLAFQPLTPEGCEGIEGNNCGIEGRYPWMEGDGPEPGCLGNL